jgi:UDP-N-acetylmuramate-alanine ligase
MGIAYTQGYRPENLASNPDIVVVGNAISRGNPELEEVLIRKLRYTSAAATIKEEFIWGRHSLAVAGTHGKTTTTSLLAWALESAGLNPSFLIGGVAENFGTSYRLTDSKYFVIEADEYDTAYFDKGPKMWHYLPDTAIVNNIEFDHADIYRDEEAYKFAFARFINLIPMNGVLVAGWDSPITRELAPLMASIQVANLPSGARDSPVPKIASTTTSAPSSLSSSAMSTPISTHDSRPNMSDTPGGSRSRTPAKISVLVGVAAQTWLFSANRRLSRLTARASPRS